MNKDDNKLVFLFDDKKNEQNKKELELLNHKKRPFLSKEEFDKFMSNKSLRSVVVYYTK